MKHEWNHWGPCGLMMMIPPAATPAELLEMVADDTETGCCGSCIEAMVAVVDEFLLLVGTSMLSADVE